MKHHSTAGFPRGSALITALIILMLMFVTGSGLLSLSFQSMRRGQLDTLRARAMGLAEAGAEKALHYLRTQAPDGSTDGSWRVQNRVETLGSEGDYTLTVQNGTSDNAGKLVITSVGRVQNGSTIVTRTVRGVVKLSRENVSVWNNAIFGGVGQAGRSINGNVRIRGSVHLLGDGEPYTDADGDDRWDADEAYTDSNHNSAYDAGEPYTDTDADGHRDARETFEDINGNGVCDPPLTVTDLASEFGGDANIGNNYAGMPTTIRNLIPAIATTTYQAETVQSLNAKFRAKHGFVSISGSATVGEPQETGGSPLIKEPMDGTYVSDGFGGNSGADHVYSDNGANQNYDLGDGIVAFPTLTEPTVKNGVSYASYMDYLRSQGLNFTGNITITPGTSFGPLFDLKGNYFAVDTSGNMVIRGIVYVNGDLRFKRNGGDGDVRYVGRGTLVSNNNVFVGTDILPSGPTFPTNHALGLIARRRMELATDGGESQLSMAGAFYAQEQVISEKQNEIVGTFVSSYYSMQNVPHMYQVPALTDNLPPGMPGSVPIWVKTIRIDSWREM
jgi:Tfp pilus assembly protein PilX